MKLSQALVELKNLKSELSRVDSAVGEAVIHYENVTPEYVFKDELAKREILVQQVETLKARIQKTNINTVTENGKTLAELILQNATLRSELSFYEKLLNLNLEINTFSGVTKDTIRKVFAKGYSKYEILDKIRELEKTRTEVDSLITRTNIITDLADL